MIRTVVPRAVPTLVVALSAMAAGCGGSEVLRSTVTTRTAGPPRPAAIVPHAFTVRATLAAWRLPVARYRTMAATNGRYVFLLGGIDAGGSTVDTVYRLDTSTGATKLVGALQALTHGGAAVLLDQRAFVFGVRGLRYTTLCKGSPRRVLARAWSGACRRRVRTWPRRLSAGRSWSRPGSMGPVP